MEIVDLVGRDRRSPEYGQSSMCENRLVRLARGPIFTRHVAEIRRCRAPREAISEIVSAHTMKAVAAR